MITLYDLTFDDGRRPSPYCWRAKLALKHKGLTWRDEPCGFTEKHKIAFADSNTYPVIHDGTKVVKDSWSIAQHLEKTYSDKKLFPNDPGQDFGRFINGWADATVNPTISPMVIGDMVGLVRAVDRAYILENRGKRFGTSDFAGLQKTSRETGVAKVHAVLEPARRVLGQQKFLAGEAPAYPDIILYSSFLWPRTISPGLELLQKDDPVYAWRERMDERFA
jgi:glutathione S-transferase